MTISSTVFKNQYTADGTQTVFVYSFKIFDNTDIRILVDDTEQSLNTHYTVSGLGNNNGGSITFVTAPENGAVITLKRNEPLKQEIDYVDGDDFPATSHEEGLDRSVMRDQLLQEQVDRAIKLGAALGDTYGGDGTTTFAVPDLRGYFLRGHDDGAGNDPDAVSRTDRGDGTTGDEVGTKQTSDVLSHEHIMFSDGFGTTDLTDTMIFILMVYYKQLPILVHL